MQWIGGMQQAGQFVDGQPLERTGKQIAGTKKVVTDGPFMEGKEYVGGYVVINASNLDEAVDLSKDVQFLNLTVGMLKFER